MSYLAEIDPNNQAVILKKDLPQNFLTTAIKDSTAVISLKDYAPNKLVYESDNPNNGFAVFSEMHYPKGWIATIDGKQTDFYRVNYLLRGMPIPAGKHTIVFEFIPEVVSVGSYIALSGNILFLLWLLGGGYLETRKKINK